MGSSVKSTLEISSVSPGKNSSKLTVSSEKVMKRRPLDVRWVRISEPFGNYPLLELKTLKAGTGLGKYIFGGDLYGLPVRRRATNDIFDLHHFSVVFLLRLRPARYCTEKNPTLRRIRGTPL